MLSSPGRLATNALKSSWGASPRGWREPNMAEKSAGGGGEGYSATSAGGVHWEELCWAGTTRARLGSASHISTSATSTVLAYYRVTRMLRIL